MNIKELIYGISTLIPGINRKAIATGGTDSSRYCYSVWLRHLAMAGKKRLNTSPRIVAELGPGDSIGIGLAALISGVEKYYAFDIVEFANVERNLEIFDDLVELFMTKQDIPSDKEFPKLKPYLEEYSFPAEIITDEQLDRALDEKRIRIIRNSILDTMSKDSVIQYKVPWYDSGVLESDSVDMIFSQAVLEHVDDLDNTYDAMYRWLKTNGFMSHQIDFKCHGTADEWNGHWAYSDIMWKLIRGKRPYLLNRYPHSIHISHLKKANFDVLLDEKFQSEPGGIKREELADRFRGMSEEDLKTSGAFIQAIKST